MFQPVQTIRGIVLVVALMLSGGTAFAEENPLSANYIMEGCRNFVSGNRNEMPLRQGICLGSVNGIADAAPGMCMPTVSVGQMVRVVAQYIDSRPARLNEHFNKLALEALRAAWPCQAVGKKK
jgi:hypothetical protein